MIQHHRDHLEKSRKKLLTAIGQPADLTLLRPYGNRGDDLIIAGTRELLREFSFREIGMNEVSDARGDTALLGGGGSWCGPFHGLGRALRRLEENFNRVIILPSSFDPSIEPVRKVISSTKAKVFAREEISLGKIRSLCDADIAHDCAFFFDFEPWRRTGKGTLMAFRTDQESASATVPPGNRDISVACKTLDDWLSEIAAHERIRTDRAHVTIAGALMGKQIEYRSSSYHKIPAIVDYSLQGVPLTRLPDLPEDSDPEPGSVLSDTGRLRILEQTIASLIPDGCKFLFLDNGQLHAFPLSNRIRIPFLERNGDYWGAPGNNEEAIREFERLRNEGAEFLVLVWPAFWWLDHYVDFERHLSTNHSRIHADETLIVFDLRAF